jgi:hypothetical protein
MSFKLQIVQEIERDSLPVTGIKKYGIQNRTTVVKWLKNLVTLIGKPNTIYYVKVTRTKDNGIEPK